MRYIVKKLTERYNDSSDLNSRLFLALLYKFHCDQLSYLDHTPVHSYKECTERMDRGKLVTVNPKVLYP